MSNWHIRKGYAQLLIGGFVWVAYLGAVHYTVRVGGDHSFAEIIYIPLSWIVNYQLNRLFNFKVDHNFIRFARFIGVSAISWVPFIFLTFFLHNIVGMPLLVAQGFGVAAKTASNVVLQQLITFKDAKHADGSA